MNVLILPLLAAIGTAQNISYNDTSESSSTEASTTEIVIPTYDYIVKIGFNLNETSIPEYLIELIYSNSISETNVTTNDILSLYGLQTANLSITLDFLSKLNIEAENVLGINGFDKFLTELNIDFKDFYNTVLIEKLNISGNALRDVLVDIGIDINNFSMGMTYGDPDPYTEFKKGNFSKESVETALQKVNVSLDQLFVICRDEFISQAITFKPKTIIDRLLVYGFDKRRALDLWTALNLTMQNVYNVTTFQTLLTDLINQLNNKPSLGILTGPHNITINRKIYDTWRDKENIIIIYAESVSNKFILSINNVESTDLENIFILNSVSIEPYIESSIPYIDIGRSARNPENCIFITLENGSIVSTNIEVAENHESYFEIPKGNVTDLILGSPLICENKLYGIAREIDSGNIILDSVSGSSKFIGDVFKIVILLAICIGFHF